MVWWAIVHRVTMSWTPRNVAQHSLYLRAVSWYRISMSILINYFANGCRNCSDSQARLALILGSFLVLYLEIFLFSEVPMELSVVHLYGVSFPMKSHLLYIFKKFFNNFCPLKIYFLFSRRFLLSFQWVLVREVS